MVIEKVTKKSISGSTKWVDNIYFEVRTPRWTRVCTLCGLEGHTYTEEPIVSGYKPKF